MGGWVSQRSQPAQVVLVCTTAFMAIIISLPTTPAVYLQTLMWLVPGLSFLAAIWAIDVLIKGAEARNARRVQNAGSGEDIGPTVHGQRHHRLRTFIQYCSCAAMIGMLTIPVSWALLRTAMDSGNDILETPRSLLLSTRPGDCVFDGASLAVFRRSPIMYPSLVKGVRAKIKADPELAKALLSRVEEARCGYIRYDSRVRDLPAPFQEFLEENYVPAGSVELYRWQGKADNR